MTMTEDQLQAKCYQWFHNTFPAYRGLLWAVPNGGGRSAREGMKFKATGLVSGVHDLLLYIRGQLYTFELKVGYNRQSPEQIKWGSRVAEEGAIIHEIRDFETFEKSVRDILATLED